MLAQNNHRLVELNTCKLLSPAMRQCFDFHPQNSIPEKNWADKRTVVRRLMCGKPIKMLSAQHHIEVPFVLRIIEGEHQTARNINLFAASPT